MARDGNRKSVNTKQVDEHPRLGGNPADKQTLRLSGTTVMRRREPTNPFTASKFTRMVFDHSMQLPMVPDSDPNVAIEASQKTGSMQYRTMNRNGKPYALKNINVGGSPDERGNPFDHPKVRGK